MIEEVMIEASEAAVMAEGTFRKNKIPPTSVVPRST